MNEGEIIEHGSHEDLMQTDGFYAELFKPAGGGLPGVEETDLVGAWPVSAY